ncbi:hypothetical protein DACRYDRAFT_110590 [Dacryopinax primogenitus]|uniref:F-box domain-containing protein n=1 Tax=Dacryopinax primogenitus (strain DJM 731) TaxID=1858805 RepID=M5FYS0_DACPD|nr:uncharacterized protein DACRYDRAFT_110590 [Dacryopinax primogenitus]EJT98686.1 hypothetical protein DACRYDRAFT_110590 [Dacryopinax primogenitus]
MQGYTQAISSPARPPRALFIADILHLIFDHTTTRSLAACTRICKAWFIPAISVLWRRATRARGICEAIDLANEPSWDRAKRARAIFYLSHVVTLEFALTDEPDYFHEPYAITTPSLQMLAFLPFPALNSLIFSLPHPGKLAIALALARPETHTVRLLLLDTPPDSTTIPLLALLPALRELGLFVQRQETHWPGPRMLDALPQLRSVRKFHLKGTTLALDHIRSLGRMERLEELLLTLSQDGPPSPLPASALLPGILAPRPQENAFPSLKSIEAHNSTPLFPILQLLASLSSTTPLEQLILRMIWTDPALHHALLKLLEGRRGLRELPWGLLSAPEPAIPLYGELVQEAYTFHPLARLPELRILDLTLTSHTPRFLPCLTRSLLQELASLSHLQELRLVTFDYSFHYLSLEHNPGIALGDLGLLAQGCRELRVLQVEFYAPEAIDTRLPHDNRITIGASTDANSTNAWLPPPHPLPSLRRLLLAWSRLPPPSPRLTAAAKWTAVSFPNARLGWGRWAHEGMDVEDGVWEGPFGELLGEGGGPEARMDEAVAPGAGAAQDAGHAAPVQPMPADGVQGGQTEHREGQDVGYAGIHLARRRARAFALEVEMWQRVYREGRWEGEEQGVGLCG